jgi:hypothetical protein
MAWLPAQAGPEAGFRIAPATSFRAISTRLPRRRTVILLAWKSNVRYPRMSLDRKKRPAF